MIAILTVAEPGHKRPRKPGSCNRDGPCRPQPRCFAFRMAWKKRRVSRRARQCTPLPSHSDMAGKQPVRCCIVCMCASIRKGVIWLTVDLAQFSGLETVAAEVRLEVWPDHQVQRTEVAPADRDAPWPHVGQGGVVPGHRVKQHGQEVSRRKDLGKLASSGACIPSTSRKTRGGSCASRVTMADKTTWREHHVLPQPWYGKDAAPEARGPAHEVAKHTQAYPGRVQGAPSASGRAAVAVDVESRCPVTVQPCIG